MERASDPSILPFAIKRPGYSYCIRVHLDDGPEPTSISNRDNFSRFTVLKGGM